MLEFQKVVVIGLGYIGLPTAALIASRGMQVVGIDTKEDVVMNGSEVGAIYVAYCPERVLPGRILTELINNDRCIGGITPACTRRAQRFYKMFVRGACVATTARAAELVKLTENAFRDTNT